jgi:hypothetical protein
MSNRAEGTSWGKTLATKTQAATLLLLHLATREWETRPAHASTSGLK